MKTRPKLLFSDFFEVAFDELKEYGAYNVSLVADLPLFIDPFLLFNSDKKEYQQLHDEIIRYLKFLKRKSYSGEVEQGILYSLYTFKEVRQNWFGYTSRGNKGSGLGRDFADALDRNFHKVFPNYGEEKITIGSHLEKLCLFKEGVGKDNISDFATNLIKRYLLKYTEKFAKENVRSNLCDNFRVPKVWFNYETESWVEESFYLPRFGDKFDDYVLLTPKDLLTKDDTWINRDDLVNQFFKLPNSVDNEELRAKINNYLRRILPEEPTRKEKKEIVQKALLEFPVLIDYYIRLKEERGDRAVDLSQQRVEFSENLYLCNFKNLFLLLSKTPFYKVLRTNSYEEALKRAKYLKHVIEDNGGYRNFYIKGKCISREEDLKLLYRLTWFGSKFDFRTEGNDGRGPVDSAVSFGSLDKTNVEFKLASNTRLKHGLEKQVPIYEKSANAQKSIVVIFYFSKKQLDRVKGILKELNLEDEQSIVLVDARDDNKPSASLA